MSVADDERIAILNLLAAHEADCKRRGATTLANFLGALVSEIEDEMHHDAAHLAQLQR